MTFSLFWNTLPEGEVVADTQLTQDDMHFLNGNLSCRLHRGILVVKQPCTRVEKLLRLSCEMIHSSEHSISECTHFGDKMELKNYSTM